MKLPNIGLELAAGFPGAAHCVCDMAGCSGTSVLGCAPLAVWGDVVVLGDLGRARVAGWDICTMSSWGSGF